jgi:hypothetical protein
MITKCTQKAEALFVDGAEKKTHAPSPRDLFFFNVWQAMNSLETATEPERRHWEERGMIKGVYAPQIKLNPFHKALGLVIHVVVKIGLKVAM